MLLKLEKIAEKRGGLTTFCKKHKLNYLKVWKFTTGKTKAVWHDFGLELAAALSKEGSKEVANG
jgi:hypothetical protein